MLYEKFDKLNEIRFNFQNYTKNPKVINTFIGPKNANQFRRFEQILLKKTYLSGDYSETMSNIALGKDVLVEHFPDDTELEIYLFAKGYSDFCIFGTLNEYITKYKIRFSHY